MKILKILRLFLDWISMPEPPSAVDIWIEHAEADYRELRYRIVTACTVEMLDKLEVCVDRFENQYANLIPLNVLHPMVVHLVEVLMRERGRLFQWQTELN